VNSGGLGPAGRFRNRTADQAFHAAKAPAWPLRQVLHACVEKEAQEDQARIAQHHDERHQRAAGTADGEVAEMRPVNLGLLAGQSAQAQIGFRFGARPVAGDQIAEMPGAGGRLFLANRVGGFLAVPSSHTTGHTHRNRRFPAAFNAVYRSVRLSSPSLSNQTLRMAS
jgi:hypothetical protein